MKLSHCMSIVLLQRWCCHCIKCLCVMLHPMVKGCKASSISSAIFFMRLLSEKNKFFRVAVPVMAMEPYIPLMFLGSASDWIVVAELWQQPLPHVGSTQVEYLGS